MERTIGLRPATAHNPQRGIIRRSSGGPALLVLCGAVLMVMAGCAPVARSPKVERALSDYFVGNIASAKERLIPLANKTDEDYVLNNLRLGSVALTDYDLELAETAFYRAYEVINSVKVNDPARSAAAALVAEKLRVWKGEPFERAMANFYLGLVYYMQHDYANARAAFENSLFKLRDYGEGKLREDQYREQESNFTIAYVMLGRCWQKLGDEDKANDAFQRAAELRPNLRGLADPRAHEQSNVLLVVDFGTGPEKVTRETYSLVGFAPAPHEVGPIPPPRVTVNGSAVDLRGFDAPPIDLLAMAQDRRWQSIDTIRITKDVVGTGLIAAGAYQGMRRKPDYSSAAALIVAGALLKASSTADIRHWETLPRTTFILPLRLPPGRHDITVSFGSSRHLSQTWKGLIAPSTGDATYYIRISRLYSGPFVWPPARATGLDVALLPPESQPQR
jgi:tetratricopeptide (TPR) repeat protein